MDYYQFLEVEIIHNEVEKHYRVFNDILALRKYPDPFDNKKVKLLFLETYKETDLNKANEKYKELCKEYNEYTKKLISMYKLYDNIEKTVIQEREEEKYKVLPPKGWLW